MQKSYQLERTHLKAAASPLSGDGVHTHHSSGPKPRAAQCTCMWSLWILLRGFAFGAQIMEPYHFRCGSKIDRQNHHGLLYCENKCCYSPHADLNDVLKQLKVAGDVPSGQEPIRLTPSNGRPPDGLTLFTFTHGRSLCWYATSATTFSIYQKLRL